jgi:hypothetical protein
VALVTMVSDVHPAPPVDQLKNDRIRSLLYAGKPHWDVVTTVRPR